jgi:hypothetical protein
MKNLYKYTLLLIFALIAHQHISAQNYAESSLRFEKSTYDYGHIPEDGGSVLCSFEAKNIGHHSVTVTKIATTCGCTSAIYKSAEVAPGENFHFEVRYDPMNRPGRIDKEIIVHTSDTEALTKLRIIGYVQPRDRTLEEIYPFDMGGGLRLKSTFHAFGYVEHGKSVEERIACINSSNSPININIGWQERSEAFSIEYPKHLEPHTTGDIVLRYAPPANSTQYGTQTDIIKLYIDGKEAQYAISTQVVATDNFDIIDDISAPRADISKNIIKFGDVKVSDGVCYGTMTIGNSGASPLIIRVAETSSSAIGCDIVNNTTILPGETLEVTVTLDVRLIEDHDTPFVARIRLITNDPVRPMHALRVGAIIVE